jgi:hypothetical protein
MLSQPQFDQACDLIKECLQGSLGGWHGVSSSDLDGGLTRKFTLWTAPDHRLGRPDLIAEMYVSRKTLVLGFDSVTKGTVHAWLVQQFPGLRLVLPAPTINRVA